MKSGAALSMHVYPDVEDGSGRSGRHGVHWEVNGFPGEQMQVVLTAEESESLATILESICIRTRELSRTRFPDETLSVVIALRRR